MCCPDMMLDFHEDPSVQLCLVLAALWLVILFYFLLSVLSFLSLTSRLSMLL